MGIPLVNANRWGPTLVNANPLMLVTANQWRERPRLAAERCAAAARRPRRRARGGILPRRHAQCVGVRPPERQWPRGDPGTEAPNLTPTQP